MKKIIKPHKNFLFYLLSLLYGFITTLRNFLFDKKILSSIRFQLPIISVGNLAVGGTGKTPHIEYLIELLQSKYKIAVLSRGYKRETKGFILATENTNAKLIGDEPFQLYSNYSTVKIAVDEKRVRGVNRLIDLFPDIDVILLDDAFQHRHIQPDLNILLTDYHNLFTQDAMLPYGTLREYGKNHARAQIVVVTKCPSSFVAYDELDFRKKLGLLPYQDLYFSSFQYEEFFPAFEDAVQFLKNEITSVLLFTAIANPSTIINYIKEYFGEIDFKTCFFPDHHNFTQQDINYIVSKWEKMGGKKIMITTEKDFSRLKSRSFLSDTIKKNTFVLPVRIKILNQKEEMFNQKIDEYVRKNQTNG